MKDGKVTQLNKSSGTTSEIELKDGVKNGPATQTFPNGKIWKEVNYKNGALDGLAKIYDKKGNLDRTVNYKEGKKHGTYKKYFNSGKAKAIVSYDNELPLPGIVEYDYTMTKIAQPEIQVEHVNNLVKNGSYQLRFSLDTKVSDITFYAMPKEEKWSSANERIFTYKLPRLSGSADTYFIEFNLQPGYMLANQINIYATYKSKYGLDAVSTKSMNLAIENPL